MSQVLVVSLLLGASFGLALAGTRGVLTVVLHLMTSRHPVAIPWRPLAYSATLFLCWYLASAVAESHGIANVVSLFSPGR